MSKLPLGWKEVTLGDVGLYHNGYSFKSSEWKSEGRPIISIQNLTNPKKPFNYFQGDIKPENEIDDGDFLISWSGTLGAFLWNRGPAVLNQHIFKVESFIDQKYHYYLVSKFIAYLYTRTRGTGLAHVTKPEFEGTKVPLAPLEEQLNIAKKLDIVFDKISFARETVEQVEEDLERISQSLINFVSSCLQFDDVNFID